MIVTCEACSTRFNLKDELLKPSGTKVRCSKCHKVFRVYPPITEEFSLAPPAETPDINLEISSNPPSFEFSQLNEHEALKITLSDHSSKTSSSPKEYLDMTEYDFTEIDKLIQSDKPDNSEFHESENDLLILPEDLAPESSVSGVEPPGAQVSSEEMDKLLEIDLSNLSLDDLGSDLQASPSDQNFENQLTGMDLTLDTKTASSESKSLEVSLDDFEKSLEMNFADISLMSPADEKTAPDLKMDVAETETEKGHKAKEDLFSEDELSGFNDIEDLDLSDIDTLLEERDADKFTTSLSNGTENFKRSESLIVPASSDIETDMALEMEDQYLTFDELQLDKEESESATLLEVKESFPQAIEKPEPPMDASLQKESNIHNAESGDEEKPLSTDAVVEEEPQSAPKKGISPLMIVALILAVIAGLIYGGYTLMNSMGIPIPFISKPVPSKVQDPGNFRIKPFDISSRFIDNTKIGKFFIITGKVKNEYPATRGSIQVIGKLYTKDKAMAKAETVFCGNIISDIDLANAEPAIIQERLQNRSGDNGTNEKVAPGDAIPFMIVFSNLPDNLEEFTLEVKASVPL